MNYYSLLKINKLIKSSRIKLLGIACLYSLKKRYLNVFLDPVSACNLRCKMCYFSDPNYVQHKLPPLSGEELELIARNFFPYTLRLQIGCSTEPTLYKYNADIVRLAKKNGVGQVSFTTNANLLKREHFRSMLEEGLDEIIISMHGVQKETYEYMMQGAYFEAFHQALSMIEEERQFFPRFKLRINYTINPDNLSELKDFFPVMGAYRVDTLQLRPIRRLGDTVYNEFDLLPYETEYARIIQLLIEECRKRSVTCLATPDLRSKNSNKGADIVDFTYCYISKRVYGEADFDIGNESWRSFCKRTGFVRSILKSALFPAKVSKETAEAHTNYDVLS